MAERQRIRGAGVRAAAERARTQGWQRSEPLDQSSKPSGRAQEEQRVRTKVSGMDRSSLRGRSRNRGQAAFGLGKDGRGDGVTVGVGVAVEVVVGVGVGVADGVGVGV
ncbi:MAG: hypothetical protein M5U18_18620 [Dehalococcoidia bacterium]|nr:hypothetical protein [Dehalococcoidia bacterium]